MCWESKPRISFWLAMQRAVQEMTCAAPAACAALSLFTCAPRKKVPSDAAKKKTWSALHNSSSGGTTHSLITMHRKCAGGLSISSLTCCIKSAHLTCFVFCLFGNPCVSDETRLTHLPPPSHQSRIALVLLPTLFHPRRCIFNQLTAPRKASCLTFLTQRGEHPRSGVLGHKPCHHIARRVQVAPTKDHQLWHKPRTRSRLQHLTQLLVRSRLCWSPLCLGSFHPPQPSPLPQAPVPPGNLLGPCSHYWLV